MMTPDRHAQQNDGRRHPHTGPGVTLTRRATLRSALALPAFAALTACVTGGKGASMERDGPDADAVALADRAMGPQSVAAFLDDWQVRTAEAVQAGANDDDAHLHALLADLGRLDLADFPGRTKDAFSNGEFTSGPILGSPEFLVLEFELQPGARITAHNHVGWSFVSVGVEGEATVRHYEPDGDGFPDPGTGLELPFALREVQRTLLTRGRSSSLTRTRANIHAFVAGAEGARFIDFGVNYREPGAGYRSFSKLAIEATPSDLERGIHEARWIGNPPS